jgi:hypothetical protein
MNRFLTSFGMTRFSGVELRGGGKAAAPTLSLMNLVIPSQQSGEVSNSIKQKKHGNNS